jgi:GMP synthase-like glutamine amidotransferase
MRIHVLQHVAIEGPAFIQTWAQEHGHELSITHLYRGETPPPLSEIDWLVIMGGPMSVHDEGEIAWLRDEKRTIRAALDANKTVLGICLGAQLIADVLGAPVTLNSQREIGWFPVEKVEESPLWRDMPPHFTAFHWHGETFALPAGAVHLARSEACENQAFAMGHKVLGLQFHLEVTPDTVQQFVEHGRDELQPTPFVQSESTMYGQDEHFSGSNQAMRQLLDNLAAAE